MANDTLAEKLSAGLVSLFSKSTEPEQVRQLLTYLQLLHHWNRSFNLTAVRDPEEMVTRHLLDSVSVLSWIDMGPLLDAGAGAGLPGIPLAIMRPDLEVILLDSSGKKVRFMNHVARALPLPNIHPVQDRLESWMSDEPPRIIISRAFAELSEFVRVSRHLTGPETRLLAMKGKYPESELENLPAWLRVDSIEKLTVPGLQEDRHLVIMSLNP